jgi:copper resistance protein B
MTRAPVAGLLSIAALMLATAAPAFAQTDPHAGHQPVTSAARAHAMSSAANTQEPSGKADAKPGLPPFITPLSDEDRRAAFPDVEGHAVHDEAMNYLVLFDQVEWQTAEEPWRISVDSSGWLGRDRDRLWYRAQGEGRDGGMGDGQVHLLYGRQFSRWWDIVGGIRQDVGSGPARSWAAVGIQGLAPYWFEVAATAYIGGSGRTHARFEAEYELLLTNRLVVQPLIEVELFGKSDPERGIGAGLSTIDGGLRLRYEFRRELAPYIGVTWNWKYGNTARFAEAAGEDESPAQFVTGVRLWF